MPANTAPIFTLTPVIGAGLWSPSLTANTKSDGVGTIGTDMVLLLTGGTDGTYINRIRLNPVAGVASTGTTATVARFYLSTQSSGATTAANTRLFAELTLAAQTADQSGTANPYFEVPCGFYIPSTQSILMSMHAAAAANTAWQALVFAGNY